MSTLKFAKTSVPAHGLVLANLWFVTLLLAVCILTTPFSPAAEFWPTTKFKIHVGSPYKGDMTDVGQNVHLYEREDFVGISNESRQAFEAALSKQQSGTRKKASLRPGLSH